MPKQSDFSDTIVILWWWAAASFIIRKPTAASYQYSDIMPINGNVLAKYLVMVSQVIAWCTVSVMLLRRGMNQVSAVTQPSPLSYNNNNNNAYGSTAGVPVQNGARDDDGENATTDAAVPTIGLRQDDETKSFDEAPAVVAGIIMITIAVIMLIISPTIMLLKIIEKRKNRILDEVRLQKYNHIIIRVEYYNYWRSIKKKHTK